MLLPELTANRCQGPKHRVDETEVTLICNNTALPPPGSWYIYIDVMVQKLWLKLLRDASTLSATWLQLNCCINKYMIDILFVWFCTTAI
ncbi:hypothetical protein CEXT_15161 [Caerostris extrusa]|uniref:Uncharacterized protein n=1 Tax=Caerostris extrusa TaxID=172846 RepID=A0AAV4MD35_CAEEX|nr:hypothetical protein CEXT_15161 [Caerostris extrusa]